MTLLERLRETDRRTLEPASTFEDHVAYVVARSDRFSDWYQANHIELRVDDGRTLDDWEAVYRQHFDPDQFRHVAIIIPENRAFGHVIEEAGRRADDGITLQHYTWMFATSTDDFPPLPEGLEVRPVRSEQDWIDITDFGVEEARGEPWFNDEQSVRRFLLTRRYLTDEIGVEWLRLMRPDSREILARLGLFDHGGISRLQAVGTAVAHRRQGLAGILLGCAVRRALEEHRSEGLALAAETDSDAHRLYARLGFQPVGTEHWIFRYP